ncbi:hypothetical protein SAMN05444365_104472 [Micromonospora pattaloongensis]|uniref:Uncharacterized protein n=1 Tax=Micromonospora pattaloongensis TaxID=405436 RepID=A0A1H3PDY0_9ACTN|nr:hypothetical protein SAMN05444365_104472 [Micromonospora pattaloongensis]
MWQPRRLRALLLLYDAAAWCAGFIFAAWIGDEFGLPSAGFGPTLGAAGVATAGYALVARLRPVPAGRLTIGSRLELETLTTTVALTTTLLLAGLSLLGNRPLTPAAPVIAGGVALALILAARVGYRLRRPPTAGAPYPDHCAAARGRIRAPAPDGRTDAGRADAGTDAGRPRLIRAAELPRTALTDTYRPAPTVAPLIAPTSALTRRLRDRIAAPDAVLPRRRGLPIGDPQPAPPPERSRRERPAATVPPASPRRSRTPTGGRKNPDARLPGQGRRPDIATPWGRNGRTGVTPFVPNLTTYRTAVAELLARVAPHSFTAHRDRIETIIVERLAEPSLAGVLAATPAGVAETTGELLRELDAQHRTRGAALDVVALIRIYLLSRIDAMWWGETCPYVTDADVLGSDELVDLDPLRRRKLLRFRYRRQAQTLLTRVTRAAERRVWTARAPRTAGLLFTRARPEAVALLNRLSRDFARICPPGTPPLWVTSLTRSIEHQHRLRALGYAAMLPSSHCVGYGMDIEMSWFRRFDAHRALEVVLLEHQGRGGINVIDEGQVWHVCVSPTAVPELRAEFGALGGDV